MIPQFKDAHRWLSNFHPCEIRFRGVLYASVDISVILTPISVIYFGD
jgi:hypothetical protein